MKKETKEKILKALKNKQEIVINKCFGGFELSNRAIKRYLELKGKKSIFYMGSLKFKNKEVYKKVNENYQGYEMIWVFTKDKGEEFSEKLDNNPDYWGSPVSDIKRDDEVLVQVVKELGKEANGEHSELKVVEIPSGVEWEIDNYDGMETIEEKHRSWG